MEQTKSIPKHKHTEGPWVTKPEECGKAYIRIRGASTFLRLLNAGQRNEACAEITKWIKDGGRDCRVRANGCAGQVDRRMQEDELCLVGVLP
jgi:GH24 family phage-related lysozyme (muramidase)